MNWALFEHCPATYNIFDRQLRDCRIDFDETFSDLLYEAMPVLLGLAKYSVVDCVNLVR